MVLPAAGARSLLFVPATRPDRWAKAFESGADAVILDLEDAVAAAHKAAARDQLADRLPHLAYERLTRTWVRINAASTCWHGDDLAVLRGWIGRGLGGVVVPKSESVASLGEIAGRLGAQARLVALIESLAGLDAANGLAAAAQVVRLAFGHLDFQLDLGMRCSAEEPELAFARSALVAASRRAQLPAPIDGVTTDTGSRERLHADTLRARAFGFGGKLCIHPAQVAVVNDAFTPSSAEVEWAHRVVEQAARHGGEAFSLDGRMVDLPVIRSAEAILRQAFANGRTRCT